jgi:hypothetical protein
MYEIGQGTTHSYNNGRQWYTWAGHHGNKKVQCRTEIIYCEEKPGVNKDYKGDL